MHWWFAHGANKFVGGSAITKQRSRGSRGSRVIGLGVATDVDRRPGPTAGGRNRRLSAVPVALLETRRYNCRIDLI